MKEKKELMSSSYFWLLPRPRPWLHRPVIDFFNSPCHMIVKDIKSDGVSDRSWKTTKPGRTPKENVYLHCSESEEVELIRLYAISAGFVERLLINPACKDTSLLRVVFVLLWKARRPELCWSHCILQLSLRGLSEMVHCYVCASIWTFQVRP